MRPKEQSTEHLEDLDLEFDGERYLVSAPEPGDVTSDSRTVTGAVFSMGITAQEVSPLAGHRGQLGRLVDAWGRERFGFLLEKVDPQLDVIVGRLR